MLKHVIACQNLKPQLNLFCQSLKTTVPVFSLKHLKLRVFFCFLPWLRWDSRCSCIERHARAPGDCCGWRGEPQVSGDAAIFHGGGRVWLGFWEVWGEGVWVFGCFVRFLGVWGSRPEPVRFQGCSCTTELFGSKAFLASLLVSVEHLLQTVSWGL